MTKTGLRISLKTIVYKNGVPVGFRTRSRFSKNVAVLNSCAILSHSLSTDVFTESEVQQVLLL